MDSKYSINFEGVCIYTIDMNPETYDRKRFDMAIGTAKTFLSNYEQLQFPIIDKDRFEYWNSEGYYMAQRTSKFHEKQYISEASLKGGQASRNARKLFALDMDQGNRIQYMIKSVRAKFAANTYLAKKLEDTGETEIIEKNWWGDVFFGVDEKTLIGANILGKILMALREELKTNPKLL